MLLAAEAFNSVAFSTVKEGKAGKPRTKEC
jgi:hypothetical protein